MTHIGYSLVRLSDGAEVWSGSLPTRITVAGVGVVDFDQVGQVMPDSAKPSHKLVERVLVSVAPESPHEITGETVAFDGSRVTVSREYAVLPHPRRLIDKAIILERLTDEQLSAALSAMTQRQRERWRVPGKPQIYADDPELLAVLVVIGADAEVVLAP